MKIVNTNCHEYKHDHDASPDSYGGTNWVSDGNKWRQWHEGFKDEKEDEDEEDKDEGMSNSIDDHESASRPWVSASLL